MRRLREQALLSQHDLARRAGVSERTIWNAESGLPVRPSTARRIIKALGLNPAVREDVERVFPDPDAVVF